MSNGFPDLSYTPYVTKTALDSMPLNWGDSALANTFGTTAQATGTDSADGVAKALSTPPETAAKKDWYDTFISALEGSVAQNAPTSGTLIGQKLPTSPSVEASKATWKKILYGALFVVVGLLIISRGFGLLGEEGTDVVVNLGDPKKFPGIGHAVRGLKSKG